ncbi:MAG: T9SS type A sorting domain-containing protein, partial [Bacteroidales bacterium]|nr:T9SS type A sorting domain-containing protein [Bacteroidales bacterium]
MKQFILFLSLVWCCLSLAAQSDVTLTFSCQKEDGGYVRPDSILIQNVDRAWSDRIFYPDTVYQLIVGTDVRENEKIDGIAVSPNPFHGETNVRFALEGGKDVLVEVVDLSGHPLATATAMPNEPGIYSFRVALSKNGVYLLSVKQAGKTTTTKLVNVGKGGGDALKLQNFTAEFGKAETSSEKAISSYPFELGDKMTFNGYASGEVSKDIVYHPFGDDSIALVFGCPYQGDGLPCQNTPTVTDYDGNTYTTVKVGCQCWLKENLRTTHYADGTVISL